MTLSLKLASRSLVATLLLAAGGCAAAMAVSSYMPRGANLAQYRTYNWAAAEVGPTGDPRLDHNPFFDSRVRSAVDRQLRRRGFEQRPSGVPDLLVHYHASITQELVITPAERTGATPEATRREVYEPGTLLVDLMDARTETLVWRGWARTEIGGMIDNQEWLEQTIDTTVARILQKLPVPVRAGVVN